MSFLVGESDIEKLGDLAFETGQHIFFYTDEAMRMIAKKYGYRLWLPTSADAIFSKTGLNFLQRAALRVFLSPGFHRLKVAAAGL